MECEYDVLIVGSGIAGQAVLSRLSQDIRVGVIECGAGHQARANFSASKSPLAIREEGDRVFGFGGTSVKWGGNVVPFNTLELSHGLWPIGIDEIQPLIEPALEFLGFGADSRRIMNEWKRDYLPLKAGQITEQSFFRLREPSRRKVLPDFSKRKSSVTWIEGFWCESVVQQDGFVQLEALDLSGQRTIFRAKKVVLANGGLESLRILSHSDIGKSGYDLGAAWSPHLCGVVGWVNCREPLPFGHKEEGKITRTRYLHISSALEPGVSGWQVTFLRVRTSLFELPKLKWEGLKILFHFIFGRVLGYEPYLINVGGDQEQNPASRVELLGGERAGNMAVSASMSVGDSQSIARMLLMVGEYLKPKGRVTLFKDPTRYFEGRSHHLGGAPISRDLASGIVDRNLALHGARDVFVCSSAVFPTFSSANPTLMVTQLAIRLGNHLDAELRGARDT